MGWEQPMLVGQHKADTNHSMSHNVTTNERKMDKVPRIFNSFQGTPPSANLKKSMPLPISSTKQKSTLPYTLPNYSSESCGKKKRILLQMLLDGILTKIQSRNSIIKKLSSLSHRGIKGRTKNDQEDRGLLWPKQPKKATDKFINARRVTVFETAP